MKKLVPIIALSLISSASFAGIITVTTSYQKGLGNVKYFDTALVSYTVHTDKREFSTFRSLSGDPIRHDSIQYAANSITITSVGLPKPDGSVKPFPLTNCSSNPKPGELENKINLLITGSVVFGTDTRTVTCQKSA